MVPIDQTNRNEFQDEELLVMNGNYEPEEIKPLVTMLEEMIKKEKVRALGEWVRGHHNPAPQENKKVQELIKRRNRLKKMLEKAESHKTSIGVRLPVNIQINTSDKEAGREGTI